MCKNKFDFKIIVPKNYKSNEDNKHKLKKPMRIAQFYFKMTSTSNVNFYKNK